MKSGANSPGGQTFIRVLGSRTRLNSLLSAFFVMVKKPFVFFTSHPALAIAAHPESVAA
ncbi:MAG: hypothetical protein ACU83V_02340 [Gammaproteobacteria bacterium]